MTTATTTDPRTLMRQLAADSLGATVAEIEDSENLISLGLDSVAMIGISARVREATGLQVPFAAFARDASVDGWTRIVAEAAAEGPADAAAATDLSPAGSPLEAAPSPWPQCSTPTGWAALRARSSAVLPRTSTPSSTVPRWTRIACPPRWTG